jgi:tRNA(Ile)-lysidine synthase
VHPEATRWAEPTVDAVRVAAGRHALLPSIARGFAHAFREAGTALDSERLLLLVSGGSDSMALLVAAVALAERTPTGMSRLAVLSLDHGLRADSADETAFVARWARGLGIREVRTERLEVRDGGNLLANAREARYLAARRWQCRLGCAAMVAAHQADDRAETALLAFARGGDAAAVVGMRWARLRADLPATEADGAPDPWLLRPLLGIARADLRGMLVDIGVPWIEDPSNDRRARGALRSDPATAEWIRAAAARGGAAFDEFESLLAWREREVSRLVGGWGAVIPRVDLEGVDPALRAPVVQAFVRRQSTGGAVAVDGVAAADGSAGLSRRTLDEIAEAIADGARHPRRWRVSAELEILLDRAGLTLAVSPRTARGR